MRTWEKHFHDESKNQLKAAARELTFGNVNGASMGSDANSKQISLKNCLWSLFVYLVHSETVSVSMLQPANSRFSWVSGVTFNTTFPKGTIYNKREGEEKSTTTTQVTPMTTSDNINVKVNTAIQNTLIQQQ